MQPTTWSTASSATDRPGLAVYPAFGVFGVFADMNARIEAQRSRIHRQTVAGAMLSGSVTVGAVLSQVD